MGTETVMALGLLSSLLLFFWFLITLIAVLVIEHRLSKTNRLLAEMLANLQEHSDRLATIRQRIGNELPKIRTAAEQIQQDLAV